MAVPVPVAAPKLLFFSSSLSGRSRRVEGYLAQVLQRRHNHGAFELVRIPVDDRPDLAKRFRVTGIPTLLVVVDEKVVARIVEPRGSRELEQKLHDWLR